MKKNIYRLFISALFVSVGLTSCLSDSNIDEQKYGLTDLNANKIIEIPSTASHTLSLTSLDGELKSILVRLDWLLKLLLQKM